MDMSMNTDQQLREHVLQQLRGGHAHLQFDEVIAGFPEDARGRKVRDLPYTAWQILEHIRIAQWDILEFSRDATHVSPQWPKGYWPESSAPPTRTAWSASAKKFRQDLEGMIQLVENPATDLFARIPHGTGQTILREALLVIDHSAYHLGQLVLIKRLLKAM
jgi:hypothetical protein